MKHPFKYLTILFVFGLFACEHEVDKPPGSYLEYLSDKAIVSIQIFDQSTWILSVKQCDTCYVSPTMSFRPTISQLTLITDSSFGYDEPTDLVIPCQDSKGVLYTASYNKVYKINDINDYSLVLETGDFYFTRFSFDKNDHIWFSGYDGIAYWDGFELNIFNEGNSELPSHITHGLTIDDSGIVWVASDHSGLLRISQDNWKIIPNSEIPGLRFNSYLRNPIADSENMIWFEVFNTDTISNILTYDNIDWEYRFSEPSKYSRLNIDSKGTIWVINNYFNDSGFDRSTLHYYLNGEWISFDVSDIKSQILTINADESNVYIGTLNGLFLKLI
jgi:ligand-binding sensor domain-containing protein